MIPAPEIAPDAMRARRRLWPWLLAIGAVGAGIAIGVLLHRRAEARARFEAEFPIAALPSDGPILSAQANVWASGRAALLASLSTFEREKVRVTADAAACPLYQNAVTDTDLAPNGLTGMVAVARDGDAAVADRLVLGANLQTQAAQQLDTMLAAARRGRFRTQAGRLAVVDALRSDALIVLDIREETKPEMTAKGARTAFHGGYRVGIAYAFDRTTGALRCAGAFEAESSKSLTVLEGSTGALGNELASLHRDFEAQTDRAIAKALRVVAAATDPNGQALSVAALSHKMTPEQVAEREAGCKSGTVEHCTDLALAMARGDVPDEPARRIQLLQTGCDGGDMLGCTFLGSALLIGRDIDADIPKGVELLERACKAQVWTACHMLASAHATGKVTPADTAKARGYYKLACDHDVKSACDDLEILDHDGKHP